MMGEIKLIIVGGMIVYYMFFTLQKLQRIDQK